MTAQGMIDCRDDAHVLLPVKLSSKRQGELAVLIQPVRCYPRFSSFFGLELVNGLFILQCHGAMTSRSMADDRNSSSINSIDMRP